MRERWSWWMNVLGWMYGYQRPFAGNPDYEPPYPLPKGSREGQTAAAAYVGAMIQLINYPSQLTLAEKVSVLGSDGASFLRDLVQGVDVLRSQKDPVAMEIYFRIGPGNWEGIVAALRNGNSAPYSPSLPTFDPNTNPCSPRDALDHLLYHLMEKYQYQQASRVARERPVLNVVKTAIEKNPSSCQRLNVSANNGQWWYFSGVCRRTKDIPAQPSPEYPRPLSNYSQATETPRNTYRVPGGEFSVPYQVHFGAVSPDQKMLEACPGVRRER